MATDKAHRPPLDLHGLHARYANATYVAASKGNMLDTVENELAGIKLTATNSEAFRSFLENPLISRDNKEKTVEDMLKGKVSKVTMNLMLTLAGNARLAEAPKIADTYSQLMKAKRGEVEATITSADPLTKAQVNAIEAAMKNQVGAGKSVVLSAQVDPSILGGLQVQIGDQFLDLSVGSKIDSISRSAV
jgi:F-type H+-transporting ATPase subunit O